MPTIPTIPIHNPSAKQEIMCVKNHFSTIGEYNLSKKYDKYQISQEYKRAPIAERGMMSVGMLNLVGNYNYKFIKDDTQVFMLAKRPVTQFFPSHKLFYYSEPYVTRDRQDTRNALIGFKTIERCRSIQEKLRVQNVDSVQIKSKDIFEEIDKVEHPFTYEDIHIESLSLYDAKHMANSSRMPLFIIMDEQDGEYSVFYHKHKFTETNRKNKRV